eukprot:CAMPEP_0115009238 /NCGR_PEP_ID=MMETSP0216-20121206/22477_1 /TAXON_ID=223996 /ORGANISM="Protocruzia adherens, Strain Boccale" /LENGTH=921 /DNA_ID=CAMNT_0002376975 /DNA_START=26 /DNA_END=2791 /DNA_ORIENTATION=+
MNSKTNSRLSLVQRDHSDHSEEDENEEEDYDIMSLLNSKKLEQIKKDFISTDEDGLSLNEFIKVMLSHLPKKKNEVLLVKNLIELFKQIDVNGDETLEWEEFSNHIIELGMIKKDRTFLDAIKTYYPSDIKDEVKHDTEIESLFYFEPIKSLIVMERDSDRFKVYNINGECKYEPSGHKGAVFSAEYIYEDQLNWNYVATTSNDLTINLWDAQTFVLRHRISTPDIQMAIRYLSTTKHLLSAGFDSFIHVWDLEKLELKHTIERWDPCKRDQDQTGHSGPIMALLEIPSQSIFVSGGMDAKICLWDVNTFEPKKDLQGHKKGVLSLDWSDEHNVMFSAGLDHDANAWNPYVKEKIFSLKGHTHSLVGVKVLPNTPQIITGDISGIFKVWDIRTSTCIQTFNCNSYCNDVGCFSLTYPTKRIVVGGRKMYFYDYNEPKDHHLADENACLNILYNEVFFIFITVHPKCVKTWDACTGKLSNVFRDLTKGELTCASLDNRLRKLFIGDNLGKVFTIDVKNGAKMKKFVRHSEDTSSLVYWEKGNKRRLISASWDGTLRIHDDSTADYKIENIRYEMNQHKEACNNLSLKIGRDNNNDFLASAADDHNVIITNLTSLRTEHTFNKHDAEVKVAIFLNPYDVLVSCDLSGKIYFYCVGGPMSIRNLKLYSTGNACLSETQNKEDFAVNALAFNSEEGLLYAGDEIGNIRIWDVSKLILKVTKLSQSNRPSNTHEEPFQYRPTREKLLPTSSAFITSLADIEEFERDIECPTLPLISFQPEDVLLLKEWKAHSDGITSVSYYSDPPCVTSSSFDCNAHIWSPVGEKLGTLILGHDPNWRLKPDVETRSEQEMGEAVDVLEEVRAKVAKEVKRLDNRAMRGAVDSNSSFDSDDTEDLNHRMLEDVNREGSQMSPKKTPLYSRQMTRKR